MKFPRQGNLLVVLTMVTVLTAGIAFVFEKTNFLASGAVAVNQNNALSATEEVVVVLPPQKLSNPPEIIKAVYVTGYSAGTKKYIEYLSGIFEKTEINAVVIDIKGSDGRVSYASGAEDVKKYNLSSNSIKDIDGLVRFFHDKNIYVIGRIAVFEDPVYSKVRPELAVYDKIKTDSAGKPVLWRDNNGLSWLDPASKEGWDYNISLAKDAFYHGFDEMNFDYIRFPSDGKVSSMGFPVYDALPAGRQGKTVKSEVIKKFFEYVRSQLSGEKISADLFGQTTVNRDDMGIGQIIEDAYKNFDYVSPMIYPSHYINGFIGFKNPAEHPYEVVKYSIDSALARQAQLSAPIAKFRPWLQDFNMGAEYTAEMVKQEIKATQDSLGNDFNGFMLWNPYNIYTKEAVSRN